MRCTSIAETDETSLVCLTHLILLHDEIGDEFLVALLLQTGEEHFIEREERLVEVEDEIELAHVAEVPIEHFNIEVDCLQREQLVIVAVYAHNKVQTRIPF